jgi:hypothetical protein
MQNSTSAAAEKNLSQIIKIDEGQVQQHLGEMARSTVEETLNAMLDAEAGQCRDRRPPQSEDVPADRDLAESPDRGDEMGHPAVYEHAATEGTQAGTTGGLNRRLDFR